MGTRSTQFGLGKHCKGTSHPNDPRRDIDAEINAIEIESECINYDIRNGSEISKYDARIELSKAILKNVLDAYIVESIIYAHLDGKADDLTECINDIIADGRQELAAERLGL